MFGIGGGEFLTLIVLALILIGPDRLPNVATDAAKLVRKLRDIANAATAELRENLGPGFEDLDVTDLHPKKLIRKTIGNSLDEISTEINSGFSLEKSDKKKAQIDPDLL
ncbi:MAG: sec-independent translocase [Actinomycetes bacterium]|jgi:sec-independent protein translocase protein TatB